LLLFFRKEDSSDQARRNDGADGAPVAHGQSPDPVWRARSAPGQRRRLVLRGLCGGCMVCAAAGIAAPASSSAMSAA